MSSSPASRFAARGRVLTPLAGGGARYLPDGVVIADHEGRITFVGKPREALKHYRGPLRDYRSAVMVPGFVDAHVHFPQTRIIGQATGPLLDWLKRSVFPEEARFKRSNYAHEVANEFVGRMLAAGTTTACIFSSSSPRATEVLFEHLDARGMRAVAGLTLMDRNCPPELRVAPDKAMAGCRKLIKRWHGHDNDRLRFAVTPRFALSCSRTMLRDAGALANTYGVLIQTHIGETQAEGAATLKGHRYAKTYLDVYDQAGLIGERTILAHAIHLTAPEWRRIQRAGANIAHCPDSNFFLGSGHMPLRRAQKYARAVALGSDVAAGRSFSMRRAMAYAYDNAQCNKTPATPTELLRMATLEGAEALGCADAIGSLEAGKDADLAVFSMPRHARTEAEVMAALLFDTDDTNARFAFVRGRLVHAPEN